jgi:hypothetical protein
MDWKCGDNPVFLSEIVFSFVTVACKSTVLLCLAVRVGFQHWVFNGLENGRDLAIVEEEPQRSIN